MFVKKGWLKDCLWTDYNNDVLGSLNSFAISNAVYKQQIVMNKENNPILLTKISWTKPTASLTGLIETRDSNFIQHKIADMII